MQAMHRKVLSDPRNIHVVRYDHLLNDFQNTVAKVSNGAASAMVSTSMRFGVYS
jgi:hypothetical protein